jgi:hypothetical protein
MKLKFIINMPIKPLIQSLPSPYVGEEGKNRPAIMGLEIGINIPDGTGDHFSSRYVVSPQNPGSSLVARPTGLFPIYVGIYEQAPGVYVERRLSKSNPNDENWPLRKAGVDIHVVPTRELNFVWNSESFEYPLAHSPAESNESRVHYKGYWHKQEVEERKGRPWFKRIIPTFYKGEMPYPQLQRVSKETSDVLEGMIGNLGDAFNRYSQISDITKECFEGDSLSRLGLVKLHPDESLAARLKQLEFDLSLESLLAKSKEKTSGDVFPEEQVIMQALDEVFEGVRKLWDRWYANTRSTKLLF